MRVLGDYCGTRYGVRLHLAADTRMCRECAAVVEQALNPGVERERQNVAPERYTMRCHEHPAVAVPCRECTARALADPPRPETIAAAKEAARRARSTR